MQRDTDTNTIVVILRSCRNPKVPVEPSVSGIGVRNRGLHFVMNPSDRSALEYAIGIGKEKKSKTIALSYGNDSEETLLREALAMGADRAIMLKGLPSYADDTMVEAKILSRFVQLVGCGLVCTGTRLLDKGSDMAPAVSAALLNRCCAHSVVHAEVGKTNINVTKKSDRGGRQKVSVPLPAFLLFEETDQTIYPDIEQLLDSRSAAIEEWTLSDLGMSLTHSSQFSQYTRIGGTILSRPRPVAVATPDPGLPAFERILSLLQGGIKTREGNVCFLTPQETAEELLSAVQEGQRTEEIV